MPLRPWIRDLKCSWNTHSIICALFNHCLLSHSALHIREQHFSLIAKTTLDIYVIAKVVTLTRGKVLLLARLTIRKHSSHFECACIILVPPPSSIILHCQPSESVDMNYCLLLLVAPPVIIHSKRLLQKSPEVLSITQPSLSQGWNMSRTGHRTGNDRISSTTRRHF